MNLTFVKRFAVMLVLVGSVSFVSFGCGSGGGAGAGGGDGGGFNNSPFPNDPGTGQFTTDTSGLPNGPATLQQVLRGRYITLAAGCCQCHTAALPNEADPTSPIFMAGFVSDPTVNPGGFGLFPGSPDGVSQAVVNFGTPVDNFPTTVSADNLTMDATGIQLHSPLELFLGMRTGQHHHNAGVLCDPMTYRMFTNMTDNDLWSIVAYLRSLKPVLNVSGENNFTDFISLTGPLNGQPLGLQYCNVLPQAVLPLPAYPAASEVLVTNTTGPGLPTGPATLAQVLEGRYIVTAVSLCSACHNHGEDDPNDPLWLTGFIGPTAATAAQQNFPALVQPNQLGTLFDGVGTFAVGPDFINAPNITPDATAGIGNFSAQQLFDVFRLGQALGTNQPQTVSPPMMWECFRNFTDADIWSIVAYLQNGVAPNPQAAIPSSGPVPDTVLANLIFTGKAGLPALNPNIFPVPTYPAVQEINPAIPVPGQ